MEAEMAERLTCSRKTRISETRTVEYVPWPDSRFVLFRTTIDRTTYTQPEGKAEKSVKQKIVAEGVSTMDALTTWLTTAQVAVTAPTLKRGDSQSGVVALTPSSIEALRQFGWHQMDRKTGVYDKDFLCKDPLTRFERGEDIRIIELYGSNHEAFALDGTPLPVCKFFGLHPGHMDATRYDLDKAVEILSKRSDIRFQKPGDLERRWADRKNKNAVIHDARHGSAECIVFDWIPDAETYRKVIAKAATLTDGFGSDRFYAACFDLDVFGLVMGGAAKHDGYWKHDREPDSSADED